MDISRLRGYHRSGSGLWLTPRDLTPTDHGRPVFCSRRHATHFFPIFLPSRSSQSGGGPPGNQSTDIAAQVPKPRLAGSIVTGLIGYAPMDGPIPDVPRYEREPTAKASRLPLPPPKIVGTFSPCHLLAAKIRWSNLWMALPRSPAEDFLRRSANWDFAAFDKSKIITEGRSGAISSNHLASDYAPLLGHPRLLVQGQGNPAGIPPMKLRIPSSLAGFHSPSKHHGTPTSRPPKSKAVGILTFRTEIPVLPSGNPRPMHLPVRWSEVSYSPSRLEKRPRPGKLEAPATNQVIPSGVNTVSPAPGPNLPVLNQARRVRPTAPEAPNPRWFLS